MCTIAILIDVVGDAPIVLAANRDELVARPSRPPALLRASPLASQRIAGGSDALSGGTWLAVRGDGHFAAVTNQRVLATPPPGLRSRGLAVMDVAAAEDPDATAAQLDPARYASMNLVFRSGDRRSVQVAYARREERTLHFEAVPRGVHVLTNDRIGSPDFPRAPRLARGIESALARPEVSAGGFRALAPHLAALLGDHELAGEPPAAAEAAAILGPNVARAIRSVCIHTPHYGTRSSSILALAPDRVLSYLHADGPPCTTAFVEQRALLEGAA